MNKNYFILLTGIIFLTIGCVDVEDAATVSFDNQSWALAVPLINSESTISEVVGQSDISTSLKVDPDGRLTLYYNGQVIRNNASAIFPPVPGLVPFPIEDTVYEASLPFGEEYVISKATFKETNLTFTFISDRTQDIDIILTMPGLSKDGEIFQKEFSMIYNGDNPTTLMSDLISVDGWDIVLNDNKVAFEYSARLPSGEKIVLDSAFMRFDVLKFSYVEGYFGNKVFDIEGDIINIGIFNNWKSGGITFEDPRVTLETDNSFGFPVRSKVNKLELETVSGDILQIESEFIDIGIDFEYPTIDEVGQVKTKVFAFNKDNSNIKDVFNERAVNVSYDFDAVANPDNDESIINFVDENSFFSVDVSVELPLNIIANQLVLVDTISLDLSKYEDVRDAEFKIKTKNDFPMEIVVQAQFLNKNGVVIDQMFDGEGLILPAAELGTGEITIPGEEITQYVEFNEDRYNIIRQTTEVEITYRLSSESVSASPVWIYDEYGITFKVGAIFNFEN